MAITFDLSARIATRQQFVKGLRQQFVKAGVTVEEGTGDARLDREIQATWGPYNVPAFKTPFDGGPIPDDIQAFYATLDVSGMPIVQALTTTPAVADSPLSAWGKDVNEKLAKMNNGGYDGLVIPEQLACSDNVVIPAGTPVASLTPKNVARAIWSEWQKLPARDTAKLAKIYARWAGKPVVSTKAIGLVKSLESLSPAELEAIKAMLAK